MSRVYVKQGIVTIMSTYKYEQKDTQRRTSGTFSNQFFKDVKEGFYKIPALKIKNRCNYDKLKHFLKLSSKRLKTEILSKDDLILKYRNGVVIHMKHTNVGLAIPLVVQIEKQGQLREAMVQVRTYCDILLDRFTLLQTVKSLDDISAEAVSSIIWASQRLALDELRHVTEQFTNKYGKCYAEACKKKQVATINEQLVRQISLSTATKDVIEKILLDIAEEYKIDYNPENKDCQTKQVVTTNKELVSQISSSTTPKDMVNLLDFSEEYNDDYIHKNKDLSGITGSLHAYFALTPGSPVLPKGEKLKLFLSSLYDVSAMDDLLDVELDKEVGLIVDAPLVLENCSPNPSGVSQLDIPNATCRASSPGGSCLATSPGGTKIWCNFDISPAKNQILNPLCHHNSDLASSPSSLNSGRIPRSNPFMDDLLDMDMSKSELEKLKDIDIKVTNPFKELMFQDDAKAASPYQHDLFEVDVPDNESSSWKSKHVEPELLFQLDIEDMI